MNSADGSADGGSINDDKQVAPSTADGTTTILVEDSSYVPAYSHTRAQPSYSSRLTQGPGRSGAQPCIYGRGSLWSNVSIYRYIEGGKRVTHLVLPKEDPTPASLLMIEDPEMEYDMRASSLVVAGPSGPERWSLAQLGKIDCGYEVIDNESKGWLAFGDGLNEGSCVAEGLILWGRHPSVANRNGTRSVKFYKNL